MKQAKLKSPAAIRSLYFAKLVFRCIVLVMCGVLLAAAPEQYDIVHGMNFFREPSVFHILWVIWVVDMLGQLLPIQKRLPLGSQKLFQQRFRPVLDKFSPAHLREYIVATTKSAYKVMVLWVALIAVLGVLYFQGILGKAGMLFVAVIFYVCDLICVLIWCPFRLMMKTRCCTTCRIFNWDHLMMFSPLIFVGGFFALSLFLLSLLVWVVWELCIIIYPERFWEYSNAALKCSNCTDKLCTQYCQKLKRNR